MIKILMIEDDLELAEILSEFLEQFEMSVKTCAEPFLGLSELKVNKYDLVILDLSLPGLDGLQVCKEIRKKHDVPIIISSARHDLNDKVNAFELGADDYLPKPYEPKELVVRIKSHLRRTNASFALSAPASKTTSTDAQKDIVCDDFAHQITFKGEPLNLTIAEYDILRYMLKKQGGAISREEFIWGCGSINDTSTNKSIDVIIGRIRAKLGEDPKNPRYIHAIRGVGYKLEQ